MHYHDSEDLERLGEFKQLAPTEFSTFVEFDKTVGRDGGAIPRKYRELIAIAVACTTQCPYCLDVHTRAARRSGATREEVAEAALLAAALRAGAGVTHGALAVKVFDLAATVSPADPSSPQ
jgi:AhpD family alkylhydroperoxidase